MEKVRKENSREKERRSIKKSSTQIMIGSGLGRKARFCIFLIAPGSDAVICISAHFSIRSQVPDRSALTVQEMQLNKYPFFKQGKRNVLN